MSQQTFIAAPRAPGAAPPPPTGYASWGRRAAAALIDNGIFLVLSWAITVAWIVTLIDWIRDVVDQMTAHTGEPAWPAPMFWGWLAILILLIPIQLAVDYVNFGKRQGRTGASFGKDVLGIMVVDEATGSVLGTGKSFGRELLHVIDSAGMYLGFLWPLWDERNRTFADIILSTIVVNQPPKGPNTHE